MSQKIKKSFIQFCLTLNTFVKVGHLVVLSLVLKEFCTISKPFGLITDYKVGLFIEKFVMR